MIGRDELTRRFAELDSAELARWIENRWILPDNQGGDRGGSGDAGWLFHEVDIARVELILEIRREFAIDDEALSLVLSLLDQVYGLRRHMRRLSAAIECQSPDVQDAIRQALSLSGDTP